MTFTLSLFRGFGPRVRRLGRRVAVAAAVVSLGGCGGDPAEGPAARVDPPGLTSQSPGGTPAVPPVHAAAPPSVDRPAVLTAVDLAAPSVSTPVRLSAGRSEWVSVVLRVHAPPAGEAARLRLPAFAGGGKTLALKAVRVYQILPMPQDVNRAGYVRQTGLAVTSESLPRALLPLPAGDGVDLARLRDPHRPADPKGVAVDQDTLLWADFRVPIDAGPGHYDGTFAVVTDATEKRPAGTLATLPAGIDVADFVLPDDRHLNMVADLSWDALVRLWPERFEVVRPQLIDRKDPNCAAVIATLDGLVRLAQEHRVQAFVPRLQPVAKWKPGRPVDINWDSYDALVGPWLGGDAFADKVPLGFWAVPKVDYLENFPTKQVEYYASAAAHFDQRDWLRLSPVVLNKETPGRANVSERLLLSAEASRVLRAHPRVRVLLPLQPDELQMSGGDNPNLIDPAATGRLNCAAPGLISDSSLTTWPADEDRPQNWLRTDLSGLIPYTGAGTTESDVRVWAWVAFLRRANLVQWGEGLPAESSPDVPANPSELVWFYPGSWFGVDEPLPTVQLKWLRRAQQDFEYLRLAEQRGSLLSVLPMARLLAKPVEIQPGQSPDAVYGLLLGTADAGAWQRLRPILTKIIESRGPGITPDDAAVDELNQRSLQWMEPLEKPVILPRTTQWTVGTPPPGQQGPWVNLRLGFDLYNASDTTPTQNELNFARLSRGWVVQPEAVVIPKLQMYQVVRQGLNARLDPAQVSQARHEPVRIDYRSGQNGATTPLDVVVPVARMVRRVLPVTINGDLSDWADDDALQIGPLVKMMSRPAVQSHAVEYAAAPARLYSGWSDSHAYFAFRVEGLSKGRATASRNFVDYQDGRAWGEDLCQTLMQAVYDDGTTGPLVHVVVKPGGNVWVERADRPGQPWEDFQSGALYAATAVGDVWRGEIKIPWAALIDPGKTVAFAAEGKPNLPTLLKFNFVQHQRDTGESASWAGPIDVGRDDAFTGVLVLKEAE